MRKYSADVAPRVPARSGQRQRQRRNVGPAIGYRKRGRDEGLTGTEVVEETHAASGLRQPSIPNGPHGQGGADAHTLSSSGTVVPPLCDAHQFRSRAGARTGKRNGTERQGAPLRARSCGRRGVGAAQTHARVQRRVRASRVGAELQSIAPRKRQYWVRLRWARSGEMLPLRPWRDFCALIIVPTVVHGGVFERFEAALGGARRTVGPGGAR